MSRGAGALLAVGLAVALAAGAGAARLELVVLTGAHELRSPPPRRLAARSFGRALAGLLRDEGFLAAAAPLLGAIPEPVVELRLQVWDGGRLASGEELRVPVFEADGKTRRTLVAARRGEDLDAFARRVALPAAGLRMVNDTRFDVLPFSLRVDGVPTLYLGEAGMARLAASHDLERREQLVSWTLLHELAHLAAPGECRAEIADRYGADWQHWAHERILPGAAFSEGWADYQAARGLPWFRRRLEATPLRVRVEERTAAGAAHALRYRWLGESETRPADRLATREGVTRLLLALEPHGALVRAAEEATREHECRGLRELLVAAGAQGLGAEALARALVAAGVAQGPEAAEVAAGLLRVP